MKLHMIGCSHHNANVEVRERLAFTPEQARRAMLMLRDNFPDMESVILSTCNRTELYTASVDSTSFPTHHDIVDFLAQFHQLESEAIFDNVLERTGEDVVRHLFTVAASLDSMVVGEAQILSQVKQAYEMATDADCAGTLTHSVFQAAIHVAKRVHNETNIHQKRVSIPSVAVGEFASSIFDRFDDKKVLIIGAGEMGEETLNYLRDLGVHDFSVVNRNLERAEKLAVKFDAKAYPWTELVPQLVRADVVISTTGASEPIVTYDQFQEVETKRFQRTLFVLDLAIPRDFDPKIGSCVGVYLFSIDDLQKACEKNRKARELEWPKAEKIVEKETLRFMTDLHHRATGPTIKRLKQAADELKQDELRRLLNKLSDLDPKLQNEIERSFDRLVNKILHPPLESLRDDMESGAPGGLLDALKRLFRLYD
ncbi:glutamyl-tRNA reductase [Bremerella cremea]|uniref:Glutamyl-tRNA reductase n=1 Tax=Bremerella cremea TaxID=1031537 RepID=A0A368KNU5_9BACT|nr:glutamyl-tRNA reductase [Bremerella cremea]RCS46095.1 glutamyl-tRNA reductase [Bremerella cremea]